MYGRMLVAAVGLSCIAYSDALAQAAAALREGQRVRVTSSVERTPVMTGVIGAVGADTILLRHKDRAGDSVATSIPLSSIARLQVSSGRHSRWLTGLLVGLGAGAASGAIIGVATGDGDDPLLGPGHYALMGAVVCAPVGGIVGVVIGALTKTERWQTVPLDRVGLSIAPGPDGRLNIGVRLTL